MRRLTKYANYTILISIIGTPQPGGLYDVVKDFQTLAAALVALVAAIIAFWSQDRVAKTQRKTALENTDKEIARSRELDEARRVAFNIMLSNFLKEKISLLDSTRRDYELLQEFVQSKGLSTWPASFRDANSEKFSDAFSHIKWDDITMLPREEITQFYKAVRLLSLAGDHLDRREKSVERDPSITTESIDSTIKILDSALDALRKTLSKIEVLTTPPVSGLDDATPREE